MAHVKILQSVSEYLNWNSKGHKDLILGLQEIMHQADVSVEMQSAMKLKDALPYVGGAFWNTSTCASCTSERTKVLPMRKIIAFR